MMRSPPRNPDSLSLAIDQGGHASRALILDGAGTIISHAERELHPRDYRDGRVEYDAMSMLRSVREAVDAALAAIGERRGAVTGAGLATQRSNVVCWDRRTGAALSPVISWQDRRAAGWLQRLKDDEEQVRRITGLPLSAHYGANKLRWCLSELPAVRRAQRAGRLAWGPMASFLLFHLLRERPLLVDIVNASRTLLVDLAGGVWSAPMLERFGLPDTSLPAIVPCRHPFGTLDLPGADIPLTVVTGDQSAALHAEGRPPQTTLTVTIGTGAFVLRGTGCRPQPSRQLLTGIVFAEHGAESYVIEGTVNGAGSALDWLSRQFPGNQVSGLSNWLDKVADPPLFLNGVSGLGTPFMRASAPIRFIGDGDFASKAVAVIESIAFLLQVNIESISAMPPKPVELRIGGGLARLDGLCQRLADLSRLRVVRSDQTETTAIGLARLMSASDSSDPETDPANPSAAGGGNFVPAENRRLQQRYLRWRNELDRALAEPPASSGSASETIPDLLPRMEIVAHRGDAGRFPENTLAAIDSALQTGIRHIEFDIQCSADGIPMLFHDDRLDRVTGAEGRITRTLSADLKTMNAGEPARFGERFRDTPIPTLADAIDRLRDWPAAHYFIEIKQESLDAFGTEPVVAKIIDTIEPRLDQCTLISFNDSALRIASELGARRIGWALVRYDERQRAAALSLAPEYLFCNVRKLPAGGARLWHGPWRWVIYEVATTKLATRLAARGIDMIETMQIERFVDAD